jgi:hypothetical protein
LVAACLVVVAGVAVAINVGRGGDSDEVVVSGAEHRMSSPYADQEPGEPPVTSSQYLEGSPTVLSTETPYAREIASVLNLSEFEILRRDRTAPDGEPLRSDDINRESPRAGYEATIYHGMPAVFFEEHDDAQLPVIDTEVGKAWVSTSGGDRVGVALANSETGIIVQVAFVDPDGHLPQIETVVDKAIELSSNDIVLEETLGR